ncbi:hypothetical protein FQA39_LY05645 [Lamprigera yunnana]|nr:hypothetical protein FQA39_LY05645 [Lamprigera yunnana]
MQSQNITNMCCKILAVLFALASFADAEMCNSSICSLPDCLCASSRPPGDLEPQDIPQFVFLTFDDAVSVGNINYYREALTNRKNPDGCSISATYFVTHEYTDYSKVHELWAQGHEIALHSITHQTPTSHWQELSVEGHKREFADQIDLISKFANIPRSDIKGIRLPFLQLSGDNSFKMIQETDLKYDCSWPTQSYIKHGLFPYTLDYESSQDCSAGPCPNSSIPGVWVVPMVDWKDLKGAPCAMVDACSNIPSDEDDLLEFMKENFHRHYNGTRSPFGFYVHAAWFSKDIRNFHAYIGFLDYLQSLNDVYLVSIQQALEWVQDPKSLGNLGKSWTCNNNRTNVCGNGRSCKLQKESEERYMTICDSTCPRVYPWLGNPMGS